MHKALSLPFDVELILKKKKRIKRELLSQDESRTKLKIAILGGSTTEEIKNILELFLLNNGIEPEFYESEYDKWYEDAVFPNTELEAFQPQIVFIHTSFVNIGEMPGILAGEAQVVSYADTLLNKYRQVWEAIQSKYHCSIIQNNFEQPFARLYGNADAVQINGSCKYVSYLNSKLAEEGKQRPNFYINDINYLSAYIGLNKWFDRDAYYLYKFAFTIDAIPEFAYNLASLVGAILGKSRKCLVLDLDNTLWGGVVGDDGVNGIAIGHETAVAESFTEFQNYVKGLHNRGVILAVASKNDMDIAKSGFKHPDSVLKVEDFAAFYANWEPKHLNIAEIAKEINIGIDSLVFIDDNPVERKIVRDNLPTVAVPEVDGGMPSSYIKALEEGHYFEAVSVSADDIKRNVAYQENRQRRNLEEQFTSYDDFLKNLDMTAEIKPFEDIYLDRITQLTNKTNQFNLTTRRYTRAEIDKISVSSDYITLYGRLSDKFGDNGLVSIIVGAIKGDELHIDLWLMSCRVLKRKLENAMLDELIKQCQQHGITKLVGYYYRTKKNNMVADMYQGFGFNEVDVTEEKGIWELNIIDYKVLEDIPIAVNS